MFVCALSVLCAQMCRQLPHVSKAKLQRSLADKAAGTLPVSGLGYDVGHDSDSDAEGWDIHNANHAEDNDKFKFRTHTTERDVSVWNVIR